MPAKRNPQTKHRKTQGSSDEICVGVEAQPSPSQNGFFIPETHKRRPNAREKPRQGKEKVRKPMIKKNTFTPKLYFELMRHRKQIDFKGSHDVSAQDDP